MQPNLPFAHFPLLNPTQARRRRVGTGLLGFSGWGEWRPSSVPGRGRGVSLPRRPSPESGGGRAVPGRREVPVSPAPYRVAAGLEEEPRWAPPPEAPGGSLGVSSSEAWPAHLFPGLVGFELHAGWTFTAQPSPRSLMSQAPIADGAERAPKGADLWSQCT